MKTRRFLGFLFALLGLAVLAGAAWWLQSDPGPGEEGAGRPPYVLPVTLATVERGDLAPSVMLTGSVRSPARSRLAFETAGLLAALEVREAQRVRAGEVLARLSSSEQELRVAAAEAELALARRELAKLEAGERAEVVRRLEARLGELEAEERLAQIELERAQRLQDDDIVSQADLDRLAATRAAAAARVGAAAESLAEARAGSREEDLAIARARIVVAEASLALATDQLRRTELRAPHDAVVLRRLAAVGDYLPLGRELLEVVDLGELEVEVEIPARVAPRLGEAPRVRLSVDELRDLAIETVLDAQVPAADERSRNFRGIVHLAPEEEGASALRPGMFVRVELFLAPIEAELVVPTDALRTLREGQTLVRARPVAEPAEGGPPGLVAEWIPVEVLGVAGGRTAVRALEGELEAGERVVVTGVDLAFPGAPLLPRGAGAEEGAEPLR